MLSILIQEAIEERIAPLSDQSLNLSGDPYGSDSRGRVAMQHWVAYQGSNFPEGPGTLPLSEEKFTQERTLEYQHYVEVEDLRRDYVRALRLHELLMGAIAGFRPNVEGVRSPLRLVSDAPVTAKIEAEVVYRYRATYRISCQWEAVPLQLVLPFEPKQLIYGVWRSPVDQVGALPPVSVLDAEGVVSREED